MGRGDRGRRRNRGKRRGGGWKEGRRMEGGRGSMRGRGRGGAGSQFDATSACCIISPPAFPQISSYRRCVVVPNIDFGPEFFFPPLAISPFTVRNLQYIFSFPRFRSFSPLFNSLNHSPAFTYFFSIFFFFLLPFHSLIPPFPLPPPSPREATSRLPPLPPFSLILEQSNPQQGLKLVNQVLMRRISKRRGKPLP